MHRNMTKQQVDRLEADRRHLARKDAAALAARAQRASADEQVKSLFAPGEDVDDADDSSVQPNPLR